MKANLSKVLMYWETLPPDTALLSTEQIAFANDDDSDRRNFCASGDRHSFMDIASATRSYAVGFKSIWRSLSRRFIFVMNCVACHGQWANGKVEIGLHGVSARKSDNQLIHPSCKWRYASMPDFILIHGIWLVGGYLKRL
jgi:hypothetical protein